MIHQPKSADTSCTLCQRHILLGLPLSWCVPILNSAQNAYNQLIHAIGEQPVIEEIPQTKATSRRIAERKIRRKSWVLRQSV